MSRMDALTKKWKNEARSFRHFRQGMMDEHLHVSHSPRLGCSLCQSLVVRSVGWKELWRALVSHWKRDSPWPWPRESCRDQTLLSSCPAPREKNAFPRAPSEPWELHSVCLPWVKVGDIRPEHGQRQCRREVELAGNSAMKAAR